MVDTYAGTIGSAGTSATQLNAPCDLAIDTFGNIFIADCGNHVVRMVPGGTSGFSSMVVAAGTMSTGGQGANKVHHPLSIALSSAGDLYVASSNSHVIKFVAGATARASTSTTQGPALTVVAGNEGVGTAAGSTSSQAGDGGPATSATLNSPVGVAVDSSNNIYISDSDKVVRMVDHSTGFIKTLIGTFGGTSFQPQGLALDMSEQKLYVADAINYVVVAVDLTTLITLRDGTQRHPYAPIAGVSGTQATAAEIGYGVVGTATSNPLMYPFNVFVDSSDAIYITDLAAQAILKVTPADGVMHTVAGYGHGYAYSVFAVCERGAAEFHFLVGPSSAVVDPSTGDMYITEGSHTVQIVGGPGSSATLATPTVASGAGEVSVCVCVRVWVYACMRVCVYACVCFVFVSLSSLLFRV